MASLNNSFCCDGISLQGDGSRKESALDIELVQGIEDPPYAYTTAVVRATFIADIRGGDVDGQVLPDTLNDSVNRIRVFRTFLEVNDDRKG
jgi:hypothetical protein